MSGVPASSYFILSERDLGFEMLGVPAVSCRKLSECDITISLDRLQPLLQGVPKSLNGNYSYIVGVEEGLCCQCKQGLSRK